MSNGLGTEHMQLQLGAWVDAHGDWSELAVRQRLMKMSCEATQDDARAVRPTANGRRQAQGTSRIRAHMHHSGTVQTENSQAPDIAALMRFGWICICQCAAPVRFMCSECHLRLSSS